MIYARVVRYLIHCIIKCISLFTHEQPLVLYIHHCHYTHSQNDDFLPEKYFERIYETVKYLKDNVSHTIFPFGVYLHCQYIIAILGRAHNLKIILCTFSTFAAKQDSGECASDFGRD